MILPKFPKCSVSLSLTTSLVLHLLILTLILVGLVEMPALKEGAYPATKRSTQRTFFTQDKILYTGIARIIRTRLSLAPALLKANRQHKYTLCNIWGKNIEEVNTAEATLKGKKHYTSFELL